MPKITFAVYDSRLSEMIEQGIVPHLPAREVVVHSGLPFSWEKSELLLVAVSGVPNRADIETIHSAINRRQRCGVIALSPSAEKWQSLAFNHRYRPFVCFVAAGVETKYARSMIPGIDVLSDIGDLVIPGKPIAEYLLKALP